MDEYDLYGQSRSHFFSFVFGLPKFRIYGSTGHVGIFSFRRFRVILLLVERHGRPFRYERIGSESVFHIRDKAGDGYRYRYSIGPGVFRFLQQRQWRYRQRLYVIAFRKPEYSPARAGAHIVLERF